MNVIDRSPTTPGRVITVLAATMAFLTTLRGPPIAVLTAAVGVGFLALGTWGGTRSAVDGGALGLFIGVVLVATTVTSPVVPLVGAVATITAWDAAENSISLGQQLGHAAVTARTEAVHTGVSLVVGATAATGAYVVYQLAAGNQPLPALLLLLFAVVVLTATLRN